MLESTEVVAIFLKAQTPVKLQNTWLKCIWELFHVSKDMYFYTTSPEICTTARRITTLPYAYDWSLDNVEKLQTD